MSGSAFSADAAVHATEPDTQAALAQEVDSPAAAEVTAQQNYSGIVTRAIAITVDVIIIDTVALIVAAAVALITAILPGSQKLHALEIAIAAALFAIWAVAYFAVFWSTTGQTPGSHMMHIRVARADGSRLHVVRAIARVGATVLAAIPLFAGFLPILFDPRRRAVNDWLVDTVVTHAEPELSADARTHAVRAPGAHGSQPPA